MTTPQPAADLAAQLAQERAALEAALAAQTARAEAARRWARGWKYAAKIARDARNKWRQVYRDDIGGTVAMTERATRAEFALRQSQSALQECLLIMNGNATDSYGDSRWGIAIRNGVAALATPAPDYANAMKLAREALSAREWTSGSELTIYCAWCGAFKSDGHAPDCKRQRALAAMEAVEVKG